MLIKSNAIDRLLRENPNLGERRFGLPFIGGRDDHEEFNPTVQKIADAIDFYGYEVRDDKITTMPDTDLGTGNPVNYPPFPLSIEAMHKALDTTEMYKYPYTEGDDRIRKVLLDYVEELGFINTTPYSYPDVDDKGLSVHNLTFMPSTSIIFNIIVETISKPGDVILVTGPNYGLFTIRAERAGAEVEILNLEKEDHFLVNPKKLANKIDEINESLQKVYNRRKGYVPRVVAFLNANPNNPTGKVMGESETELLTEIGQVCLDRGVFIIDDLVYRDISFDPIHLAKPIATIPGMFRNTISLFGLSKSYGLASLRAGFVVADEIVIREVINRIFQSMDSAPDLVGQALAGAFNTSERRKQVYEEYFQRLRQIYVDKYHLLKAMVQGLEQVPISKQQMIKNKVEATIGKEKAEALLQSGLPYVDFPKNLEPEAGFFAILDFTAIKGMKDQGHLITTERDLLTFFYRHARIRFLVGQSISWPYPKELVGRISFALEDKVLITAFDKMREALLTLDVKEDYVIRKNEYQDQSQMAQIKVEGWQNAYDKIIASKYLKSLNVEEQTKRYIQSFEEYKDLVFVAVKDDEVLGYACFKPYDKKEKYDSELVSLYLRKEADGKGIGSSLFKEVVKELIAQDRHNMIVWCLADNQHAIDFYEKLGGKCLETKNAKIGEEIYLEYGFYFDLEQLNSSYGLEKQKRNTKDN